MPEVIKGKYRIVREIARSNDIVYEAVDTTFGRKIALKELNIAAGVTGQARRERIERFNREARAAGRLNHPNIVSVFDFGEENGRYFIAMEYLEGQSLRDAMQARGAYPLGEALAIFYQVLDALSYAHTNRVVHRDIKPDNIHILPGGQAKITDFGIARLDEEPALTGDGQVFGTPSYMSPEQIEGKNIDFRSDLFSAGILLYEMLAGRKPFVGDSVISITYAIMQAEPAQLVGVPQGIEQVIRRALNKQPQMRQISADQMKMDLKNAEQTPAIFLPPVSLSNGLANPGGRPGQTGTGYGYGGPGPQGGYGGYLPQNTGYSTGASPGMPGGYPGAIPGYAPPAPAQQQNQSGLPWSWNTSSPGQQIQPASQQVMGAAPQPSGFTGLQNPHASPPFPAIKPGPAIVLSPGAKTALISVAAAILIGTCIALGIIAVQHSYDNWQETGRENGVSKLMKDGAQAYEKGDYASAVSLFDLAQHSNPSEAQTSIIDVNLAYACVKQARVFRSAGKLGDAKADYEKALANKPDLAYAHAELAELLQQMGDSAGAQEHRSESGISNSGSGSQAPPAKLNVSTPPPPSSSSSDPNEFIASQRRSARQLLDEGDRLEKSGDHDGAREKWIQALQSAPGTPESDDANSRLYNGTENSGDSSSTGI